MLCEADSTCLCNCEHNKNDNTDNTNNNDVNNSCYISHTAMLRKKGFVYLPEDWYRVSGYVQNKTVRGK